jgi:hypothetical protein
MTAPLSIDAVEARCDTLLAASDATLSASAPALADELLAMCEVILETWITAKGDQPTDETTEGFRLLALHRQAARGNPSFNACRETCREVVYHHNLVRLDPTSADAPRNIRLGAMVVRHLALFIGGKLQVDGLGDFCCSSRPIRQADTPNFSTEPVKVMEA